MSVFLEVNALLIVELEFNLVVEVFFDVEWAQREVSEEISKAKHYLEPINRLAFESEMLLSHRNSFQAS